MCTEMSVRDASVYTYWSIRLLDTIGQGESPHAVFALQTGVGFATAIPPAVRDRFWNGKPEFTWSEYTSISVTYGSVTDGGRPSST